MRTNPPATSQRFQLAPFLALILALLITAAAYWPGLHGSYVQDDYPNIVDNPDLQIKTASISNLSLAALSSPASELKRPLASLSFAANYLFTGLDPFWMKLTNLMIHLLNGVLIYMLALTLIRAVRRSATSKNEQDPRWIALWITAGWLLLPINLTAVLYVVQRMESLANIFVLLGLLGYVRARQHMLASGRGFIAAAGSLVLASGIGLMAKETAVMTPLYAALIEWAVFGARRTDGRRDRRIISLFLMILVIPLIAGLAWLLPGLLAPDTWATRSFNLPQRLWSEARIVVDYICWTLLPTPQALSFYHDDYRISTGWLTPWSTLPCALFIVALAALTIWLRKRAPLVVLGLALFLGAQLLTATILPLELAYEHRNYFASFGLLLAVIPLLAASTEQLPVPTARYLLLGGLLLVWTVETASTAAAWGSPLELSQMLAERAPNSPRAQYGLGYTYIVLSDYDPNSPFTAAAYKPLEKAMRLPGASILPEQALIMMNARMHQPIKAVWWDNMIARLRTQKPDTQDESSLGALTKCMEKGECPLDSNKMLQAFLAALSHPQPSARLLATYGDFAWNVMDDKKLGENVATDAVRADPSQPAYQITLIRMLAAQGRMSEAIQAIVRLESLNIGGRLDNSLRELRALPGLQ
jgi:hypothetical protein